MGNNFEREVLDRLTKIETKIDDYKEIKQDTANALSLSRENKREISEIQDKIKWITRTIGAAAITGFIGILFIYLKMGIGVN